jgi:hypothetical protein
MTKPREGVQSPESKEPGTMKQSATPAVGYGRPPLHSRFQKGKSGNPRGRRKNSYNLKTLLQKLLTEPITVREGEKRRSLSRLEVVVLRQIESALKGNHQAALATIKMAQQIGLLGQSETPTESPSLTPAEKQILEKARTLLRGDNDDQS